MWHIAVEEESQTELDVGTSQAPQRTLEELIEQHGTAYMNNKTGDGFHFYVVPAINCFKQGNRTFTGHTIIRVVATSANLLKSRGTQEWIIERNSTVLCPVRHRGFVLWLRQ